MKKLKIHAFFPDSMVKPVGGLGEQFKQVYDRLKDKVDYYIMGHPEEVEIPNYSNVFNLFPMIGHSAVNTISNQINYFYSSIIAQEKPDIVHTLDYTTYLAGYHAAMYWRVPLISTMNLSIQELGKMGIHYCKDYTNYDGKAIHDTLEVSELLGLYCSDKIVHVSKSYAERFPDFLEKSVVIPNGIDLKFWEKPYNKYEFKGKNKLKVVYIGRFAEMKGIKNLCKAKIPDNIDLFFVGDERGGERFNYELVQKKCNGKNIFHLNFVYGDDKRDLLKSADAVIMPSLHEPFGIVGLEALAAKTILISSFVDGMGDYLTEDFAINCGTDYKKIESALHKLSNMTEEEKNIRISKGFEIAKNHDWDILSEKYLNLYNNVFNENLISSNSSS